MKKEEFENLKNKVILNPFGYEMKLLTYRNYKDVDVVFLLDNTIVEHITMNRFTDGELLHPKYKKISQEELQSRMNIRIEKEGHIARIKEYRGSDDIDVIFDDGVIASKITFYAFTHGHFAYNRNDHINNDYKNILTRRVWKNYNTGAKSRGLEFKLTQEDFKKIIFQNCYYCNAEPSNRYSDNYFSDKPDAVYNGIDRIDSSKGYIIDNVVPCCWACNSAKKDMPYQDWINHLKNIHDNYSLFLEKEKTRLNNK